MVSVLFLFLTHAFGNQSARDKYECFRSDNVPFVKTEQADTASELDEFKAFSTRFFSAVKAGDTAFLKKHIVFPITQSDFSTFDRSLEKLKSINEKILFKKLHRLFPDDYVSKMNGAKYSIIAHKGIEKEYRIKMVFDNGEVESNMNWFFVKRKGQFYFTTFTAEAG
jgi:hypothetical protein